MQEIETRLLAGMTENGIDVAAQDQIVKSITAFALYGFPESHAASFALIAYASAYLKARYPAAFFISLLNAWPMGFYHPATLVKDAQRHGVKVLPVDVNHSGWTCRWEKGAIRLGMRFVKGLRAATGAAIEAAQPFASADAVARRARVRDEQLTKLAYAGALASLGLTLEDETGISQAIVHPDLFREHRALIVSSSGLIVEGTLQNDNGQCSVRAERFFPLDGVADVRSYDFH